MLDKVRALLAKAESTEFPQEAEALTSRAEQLMARHASIMRCSPRRPATGEKPAGRRLPVDNPYESPKAVLLSEVAQANRCKAVWSKALGFSTVLGFPSDLDAVELLFTSLLIQATSALVHEGSKYGPGGRSRTRAFRQSFLGSYASRIGERLRGATDEVVRQAAAETREPLAPRAGLPGQSRRGRHRGVLPRTHRAPHVSGHRPGRLAVRRPPPTAPT